MPSHKAGNAQQFQCQLAKASETLPLLCSHVLDAPAPNTQVQQGPQNPTYIPSSPFLHSIRTLATEFAIVVCLAYPLVAAVIFLIGPPSTTPIDYIGIFGPLCLFTALAFTVVGLVQALVWLAGQMGGTRGREGVLTNEGRDGGIDDPHASAERDFEAGGGNGKRKI